MTFSTNLKGLRSSFFRFMQSRGPERSATETKLLPSCSFLFFVHSLGWLNFYLGVRGKVKKCGPRAEEVTLKMVKTLYRRLKARNRLGGVT